MAHYLEPVEGTQVRQPYMELFGYSAMDDGYNQALEEYEAWQVDKLGTLG